MRNQKGQLRLRLPFEREEETISKDSSRYARVLVLETSLIHDGYEVARCQGLVENYRQFSLKKSNPPGELLKRKMDREGA